MSTTGLVLDLRSDADVEVARRVVAVAEEGQRQGRWAIAAADEGKSPLVLQAGGGPEEGAPRGLASTGTLLRVVEGGARGSGGAEDAAPRGVRTVVVTAADLNVTVVAVALDAAAERMALLDTIEDEEARYTFLLDAADLGDWDMDVRRNRTRRSRKHDQLFGHETMLPSWGYDDFLAHVHPDDRDMVDRCYQKALAGAGDYNVEFRCPWPDGSLHWLWSRGRFVLGADRRPIRAAGLVADITKRKATEEALRAIERDETVGRLAASIAHDFNNLLTVIISTTDLLLAEGGAGEDVKAELTQVRAAGLRSAAMVRRLLSLSRAELVHMVPLDVGSLLRELGHSLERLVGDAVHVDVVTPAEAVHVLGDARQLEQVLLNLASNARDAMAEHGTLRLVLTPEDRTVRLEVSDTGAGMDAATAARCFELLFTTKPRGRGTGIGLASVRASVQQMGGTIDVASTPGAGTTFTMRWPIVEAPRETALEDASAMATGGAGERVLLVDDDRGVREVARRILADAGYRVVTAASGEEGARIAVEQPAFDAVITDLVMPAMSGRALVEAVLARSPRTRVLMMSGYSDDEVARYGVERGTWAFLPKPFSPGELRGRLAELLRGPAERRVAPHETPNAELG